MFVTSPINNFESNVSHLHLIKTDLVPFGGLFMLFYESDETKYDYNFVFSASPL